MRILILGGTGMLGHTAWQLFRKDFDVYVTVRGAFSEVERFSIFDKKRTICGACVEDFRSFEKIINAIKPDVVLNCIGIIKQIKEASDPIKSIMVNSLFPHKMAVMCSMNNIRFIHLSTDCVFSGKKGRYVEEDISDPLDLYGRTKLLGEVDDGKALTIRTSMIGTELSAKYGLLEWVLSQNDKSIKGYTNAIFSGLTTSALSRVVKDIIVKHGALRGLYHVSSDPISKFDLLMLIKNKMRLNVDIVPDETFQCNRSLDSKKFCEQVQFVPPTWEEMIDELGEEISKKALQS